MVTEKPDHMDAKSGGSGVAFDASKGNIHLPNDGYRYWSRRLKTSGYRILSNRDDISAEFLSQVQILVLSSPSAKYSELEFNHLRKYLRSGGNILVLLSEGGEKRSGTNINFLLEEFGVSVNDDAVVRTSYYKYFHPKEALVTNGVVNRSVLQVTKALRSTGSGSDVTSADETTFSYVYPFGATLNVTKPAVAVLSSGSMCFPVQRPTCAFVSLPNAGRLVVLASAHIFHDLYIQKEDNFLLQEMVFQFFSPSSLFSLNAIDAANPDLLEYNTIPDLEHLSEQTISCLQDSESVPADFTRLFSKKLFALDNRLFAEVNRAYDEMMMQKESLRLIKPEFETPLPPLRPAVFPPEFRLPAHPALELFDLDDAFSSSHMRLIQVANKCSDEDLDYYVKECGLVLGVQSVTTKTAKEILFTIVSRIVEYKKVNADA